MESNVSLAQASTDEVVLPTRVQEALGQLVGSAKEGLLALSVGVGLGVLAELLEEEVDEVVGPKGKHNPERVAVRHGHESGEVTLGGRRVPVERPRVRSADGGTRCGCRPTSTSPTADPLSRVVLERMLAGVSTRRYRLGYERRVLTPTPTRHDAHETWFTDPPAQATSPGFNARLASLRARISSSSFILVAMCRLSASSSNGSASSGGACSGAFPQPRCNSSRTAAIRS